MRWHEHVLGGLNLFWSASKNPTQEERDLAQAFADIAAVALIQSPAADDPEAVAQRLRAALHGRPLSPVARGILKDIVAPRGGLLPGWARRSRWTGRRL